MRFRDALRWSIRYHALAILPTLLGVGIVVVAFYVGAVRPVLSASGDATLSPRLLTTLAGAGNVPLLIGGVVAGIYVRRVGRTALLVRVQSQAFVGESTESAPGDEEGSIDGTSESVGTYDETFSNSEYDETFSNSERTGQVANGGRDDSDSTGKWG